MQRQHYLLNLKVFVVIVIHHHGMLQKLIPRFQVLLFPESFLKAQFKVKKLFAGLSLLSLRTYTFQPTARRKPLFHTRTVA